MSGSVQTHSPFRTARNLLLVLGIISAIGMGGLTYNLLDDISKREQENAQLNENAKTLEKNAAHTRQIELQIGDFTMRVIAVEKLAAGRIRTSRILARLADASSPIEQLYLREFSLKEMQPAKGDDGAKLQIALTGSIAGPSADRAAKLNQLFEALDKSFEIPAADPNALKRDNSTGRYSQFLGARFERPVLTAKGSNDGAKPTEFSIIMRFEIPPANDEWWRTQEDKAFKFEPPPGQRDPFFIPRK